MGATLNSIRNKVLSQSGQEQSASWPPHIFDEQFNITSNYLIDRIVELYPGNNAITDLGNPFLKKKTEAVVNGIIKFPEDYRNILGMSIMVTHDYKSLCSEEKQIFKDDPLSPNADQQAKLALKPKCISWEVDMVDTDEWSTRTTSKYKFPTYKKPIATSFNPREYSICPYDISAVDIRYFRKPKVYRWGYVENPDGTFVFDPANTEESEWEDNATQYLVKGVSSLLAVYLRDPEFRDWNLELKKLGLF